MTATAVSTDAVAKFAGLFQGNLRSYGQWAPDTRRMSTERAPYNYPNIQAHLSGVMGLGLVPILDDGTCMFAAIDIDSHGKNAPEIDITNVAAQIERLKLPLIACRSKSGGVHCYLFLRTPTDATRVRVLMTRWAAQIGFANAEIFPKQDHLNQVATTGDRPLGNWINLPYFHSSATDRYAVEGGKAVDFDYFIEIANTKLFTLTTESANMELDYSRGPPCVERMIKEKIDEGSRNTGVFQAGIFLKRAFHDDWRARLGEFNKTALQTALNGRELGTIAGSVHRKDYMYKCREEPCKSLCNRELCKTREFGITSDDEVANELPPIDKVEQVIATPIRWVLTIRGKEIEMVTNQLFEYEQVRKLVGEKLHVVLPRMKNQEWDMYLKEIMKKVEIRKETTVEEMLFEYLCEYLRRAKQDKTRPEDERRSDLIRRQPAYISVQELSFEEGKVGVRNANWFYAFRALDFIGYLRKKRLLAMPDHQITTLLRRVLGENSKRDQLRIGGKRIGNVWVVPEISVEIEEIPTKNMVPEF